MSPWRVADNNRRDSLVSGSSGESDSGGVVSGGNGRTAPTPFNAHVDRRIPYHGNHGNHVNTQQHADHRGCHGYDTNRPASPLCEVEFDFDSDGNASSSHSGSPGSSHDTARLQRKQVRRMRSFSDDTEPTFAQDYQDVARNIGEKVVEKYRRRACTDVDQLKHPGLVTMETPKSVRDRLGSSPSHTPADDRRKSLPAQMPRKLRPILARSRALDADLGQKPPSLLLSDESDLSNANSPVVPRRNSFNPSDPLLQAAASGARGTAGPRPVRPLRIEVPESDDAGSVGSGEAASTPPDSAFLSLPTSPGYANAANASAGVGAPAVASHRPFEPHHRFSSDSGVGSRKSSLVPALDDVMLTGSILTGSDDAKAMAAMAARRDEVLARTPPRRDSDVNLKGLMPLGGIPKKPLCHTRSAPDTAVAGH